MRVVFVSAPEPSGGAEASGRWLPLSLVHLAGAARDAGHDCRILDALSLGTGVDETVRRVLAERPDVACVTSATAGFPAASELCRRLRAGGITTVVGGLHASFMYPEFLPQGGFDFAVLGDGEETLPELLHCIAEEQDPSRVAGVAFALGGRVIRTAPRPRMATLDPLPKAWDLLDWRLYTWAGRPGSRMGATVTSRGCPSPCTFCPHPVASDGAWRGRSPDSVAYEISVLRRTHGVDVVALLDVAPTVDPVRWGRLVDRLMELDLGVELLMFARPEDVVRDARAVDQWRAAGIVHVGLCRDPSEDRLGAAEATTYAARGRSAVRLLRDAGITTEATFWLGFPDETSVTIAGLEDRARAWDPDLAHFRLVAPLPYTPAWRTYGPHVITRDYRRFNQREPVMRPSGMAAEDVVAAAREATRRHGAEREARRTPGERKVGGWTIHGVASPVRGTGDGDIATARASDDSSRGKKPGPEA